ncbi:uncharacterized protein LOC130783054 isoform X2 [Actinidia eriantha]|uniref:uncharacterized protein LOC130783054 isoform X2 n=1 Tax=Actinidia eriantha TaxID=165200 RepID=UPI002590ECEA|nr:uncharacterized protein LOC130783054 isoform X2 [Actinidia eriantha]
MESMQGNTEDHLHAAQTTNEKDELDEIDQSAPWQSFVRCIISLAMIFCDRQGTSRERNNLRDHLHAAQTTDEEGIISLAKETMNICSPTNSAAHAPSFVRGDIQGIIINLQRGGMMTSQSVPGQKKVVVRPRTSIVQTNAIDHRSQVRMEGDEEIAEEEAVCKFCFDTLKEENILKTECGCKNALVHEECAANQIRVRDNNTCDYCGQEVWSFPVTMLRGLGSAQRMDTQETKKKSWISRLIRKSK